MKDRPTIPLEAGWLEQPYPYIEPGKPTVSNEVTSAQVVIDPRRFEYYPESLQEMKGTVVHVPIEYSSPTGENATAVLRMVDVPAQVHEQLDGKSNLTCLFIGGGTSDALSPFGSIAYMQSADEQGNSQYHFGNYITLSHPLGSARSAKEIDKSDLSNSANMVMEGISRASEEAKINISENGIVVMGFSAGAQMALELAARLGDRCKGVVLIEPTGVADFPHISWEFTVGNMWSLIQKALSESHKPRQVYQNFKHNLFGSWTTPNGTPRTEWEFLQALFGDNVDFKNIGKRYSLNNTFGPGYPSAHTLDHDATQAARQQLSPHIPVTMVQVLNAHVANSLETRAGYSRKELRRLNRSIIATRNALGRDKNFILTEADIAESTKLSELQRRFNAMLEALVPGDRIRQAVIYRDSEHSSPLRNSEFWRNLIPLVLNNLHIN